MNYFELDILDRIARYTRCAFLDAVLPVISEFFGYKGLFWIILAAVLICVPKTRKIGVSMGMALLMGFLVGNVFLKNAVARIRPYDLNPGVRLLIPRLDDYSFPSGHSLACFEGSVTLLRYNRRAGIPALIIAVTVAFSRLYLYVHYPTDVLAGAVMGTFFALLSCFLTEKIFAAAGKKRGGVNAGRR